MSKWSSNTVFHYKSKYDGKPCPFCGDSAVIFRTGNNFTNRQTAVIQCLNCHIKFTVGVLHRSLNWAIEKVIERWERRSEQPK